MTYRYQLKDVISLLIVLFNTVSLENLGTLRKQAGSNSYISRNMFLRFSNTLANNNA